MKTLTSIVLLITCLTLLPGCAITHEYGPYMGKVVDKESGEPIEGAVVFARFFTEFGFSPGGGVSHYADAMEVLTDNKGEYLLPAHRVFTLRIGDLWDGQVQTIIFKPGYGVYPRHPGTTNENYPKKWLRANEYDIIKLPKLSARAEIQANWANLFYSMDDVPCNKQRLILKFLNSERLLLGYEGGIGPGACGDDHE